MEILETRDLIRLPNLAACDSTLRGAVNTMNYSLLCLLYYYYYHY
jgi:hypothetical protein